MWTRAFLLLASAAAALAAARAAPASTAHFNAQFDLDSIDPALAFTEPSWQLEYATCAKLVNFPDAPAPAGGRLEPEVAAAPPVVSGDGRTYTFALRGDFRFSPPSNERVTGASFERAIERALSPAVGSPAASYVSDVTGVVAHGNTLRISLAHPDGGFLARLSMPFFCAVPADTPLEPESAPLPSAGPYYIASYEPGSSLALRRNPNYRGDRPAGFDEIDYRFGVDRAVTVAEIAADQADYAVDGLPIESYAAIATAYPDRFAVNAAMGIRYLALNTSRPLFASVDARRAVNFALDRPRLTQVWGAFGLTPFDHYLPPTMPGSLDEHVYPLNGPDDATANALVDRAGVRGETAILYTCLTDVCQAAARIVTEDLARIGIAVETRSFPRGEQLAREQTRGEPYDIALEGWVADYPDPSDILGVLLDGRTIGESGNLDISYFDDPAYEEGLDVASPLSGQARLDAFGALDLDVTRDDAPLAVFGMLNQREFFSSRLGCRTFQPVYASVDVAALCLRSQDGVYASHSPRRRLGHHAGRRH